MKYELFDYQDDAVARVATQLARASRAHQEDPTERAALVLAAPTGAGKTVIATAVIEASLDNYPNTPGIEDAAFLWVTDDPSLNRQTLHKMMDAASEMGLSRLQEITNEFDAETFAPGSVYFLNIQKLGANATLAKSRIDGRTFSLWETIANTIAKRPEKFVVVIDEAHRGSKPTRARETIVSQIIGNGTTNRPAAPIVWGISATPGRFVAAMGNAGRTVNQTNVKIEDVRASGLLKDQIILGHTAGVDAAESALVRFAVRRIRSYSRKWAAYCAATGEPPVKPALVIQVADKPSTRELHDLIATVLEEWPEITAEAIVHTFADHGVLDAGGYRIPWCPPEDIQDRAEIRVVLCKTAITTGWDCPRAEVLLSFRVANDADLITQVMGRMVRTPLARRIATDQDLNAVHCILPKFDAEAVERIAARFQAGDDGSLAGGTAIITEAVELTRNPLFTTPPNSGRLTNWVVEADFEEIGDSKPPSDAFSLVAISNDDDAAPTTTEVVEAAAKQPGLETTKPTTTLFTTAAEPLVSQFQSAPQSVFDTIASIPSYTIPRRTTRSPVERLTNLAMLLAGSHGGERIDHQARTKAKAALLSVIDERRQLWAADGELNQRIERAGRTRLYEKAVSFANPDATPSEVTDSELILDTRGIQILLRRAERSMPEGLTTAYINRLIDDGVDVRTAQLTTLAIADDSTLRASLNSRASELVAKWFRDWGGRISRLPAPDQERFDRIKRESDVPLPTNIVIPTNKQDVKSGKAWPKHILSDADGQYRAELKGWEQHVLQTELDHGAVAWYRNPTSGQGSLQIPYTAADGVKGVAPDFIFIEQVGDALRASLVDPHGTHLADAVPKLKGIAKYALEHGHEFHRLQSIAEVGGEYLMLNHLDPLIRTQIEVYEGTDSAELFRAHGVKY